VAAAAAAVAARAAHDMAGRTLTTSLLPRVAAAVDGAADNAVHRVICVAEVAEVAERKMALAAARGGGQ
jgi:hypothetical protein